MATKRENIKKRIEQIRDECDSIEQEVEEKKGRTYGDPIAIIE